MPPTSEQVAWAAGLFEGEGNFILRKNKWIDAKGVNRVARVPSLRINMTDLDVLETFEKIIPVGKLDRTPTWPGVSCTKPQYVWCVNGLECLTAIDLLFPLLHSRRKTRILELWNEYREYIRGCIDDGRGRFKEVPRALDS